jgi:hypothetical protein
VNGTWSFIVEPLDAHRSRLLMRSRAAGQRGWFAGAFDAAVFDAAHFAMERKMMTVLRARAEGRPVSDAGANLEVALWFITFAVLLACAGLVLAGRHWPWRLGIFVTAGVLLQVLTLGQPALWISVPLVLVLVLAAFAPRRISERIRELGAAVRKRWTWARKLQIHEA